MNIGVRFLSVGVGVCVGHTPPIPMSGIVITGVSTVLTSNGNVSTLYDLVLGNCGHVGIIITGSSSVVAEQLPVTVSMLSNFAGVFSGIIITGHESIVVLN